jgi:uncharacterized protein (DUF2147 family)
MNRGERRGHGADKSNGQLARQRLYRHLVTLALGLAAIAAGAVYLLPGHQAGAQSATPPAARESTPAAGPQRVFAPLQGRWMRPDGGYVIEIKAIDAHGKMVAAYFNPRPINVSQAEAALDGKTLKAFIELRDVNYPGATYHLTYDPASDQLRGVYFQPALQQSFNVVFVRLN